MSDLRIKNLIKRVNKLRLRTKLSDSEITYVEHSLNIILPNDFKSLCLNYSYESLYFFDFYNFRNEEGVIEETKYYRTNYNLPHNYVVLAQEDDVSFVLLKTTSAEQSEVIWCNYMDFFNLCDCKPMAYPPTIFHTFTDFYEFLLDEEEKV